MQLLFLRSEGDPDLSLWLRDKKYLSPDILNEQIRLMAESVLRGLLSDIRLHGSQFWLMRQPIMSKCALPFGGLMRPMKCRKALSD